MFYIQEFPQNLLQEGTLKVRLINALNVIQTGNLNNAGHKFYLQSDMALEKLRVIQT